MSRFHLPATAWSSGMLEGAEARHLAQVMRIPAGGRVTVFDGAGRVAPARVLSVSRDRVALEIGEVKRTPLLQPTLTLAQAIPKGKNMDLIVQKAVELGVARIQPLVTRHTVVKPADHKTEKWRRTALEACKQCGQNHLPEVAEPRLLEDWLAEAGQAPENGLRIIASLAPGARLLREVLRAHPAPAEATLLIGPEGDFSAAETTAALAAGFLPTSLGEIILRVETAALFCLSALRCEYAGHSGL